MNKNLISLIACFCFMILSMNFVFAVKPHLISLQGYVTDNLGSPLSSGNVAVRIYDASTGGNLIYNSGTDYNSTISNGIFDVLLGSITPLSLDNTVKYYMEIDINGQTVIGVPGRKEFWPGGGDHTHTHLKADITDFGHTHPTSDITGTFLPSVISPQGSGSGLDADLLDGQHSSSFATNVHAHSSLNAADGSPINALYVDNYGNVGIGTTSPVTNLDVAGSAKAQQLCIGSVCRTSWQDPVTWTIDSINGVHSLNPEAYCSPPYRRIACSGGVDDLTDGRYGGAVPDGEYGCIAKCYSPTFLVTCYAIAYCIM